MISIHTLRVEGDPYFRLFSLMRYVFQSTPSVWRVTADDVSATVDTTISIHTLRVEGDVARPTNVRTIQPNFNPHPPCGG